MGSWVLYGLGAETRGPARLRRAALGRARRADAADRGAAVVGRVSAEQVPGREVQLDRRPGALHPEPARRRAPDCSDESIDADQRAQPSSKTAALHDPEIQTRIAQYEMAFRMQTERART